MALLSTILTLLTVLSSFSSTAAGKPKHEHPLFPYEENPLTDEGYEKLIRDKGAKSKARLFAFDDGSPPDPDRLKSGACRVFPGDKDWPSLSTWETFDKLLGGALIKTVPIAASCYKNLGLYDEAKCAVVREKIIDPYFK